MSLLLIDQSLTNSLYGLTRHNLEAQKLTYDVATYSMYLLPVMLLWMFWRVETRYQSVKVFIFTIFTWLVMNKLIGALFYNQYGFRDRPFAASGLTELLFEQPQKAFPSDHAAVFMFITLALWYYRQKTWAWAFLGIMILSSVARVAVGFHWVGDILGGWAVGAIGFGLLVWLNRPIQHVFELVSKRFSRNSPNAVSQ